MAFVPLEILEFRRSELRAGRDPKKITLTDEQLKHLKSWFKSVGIDEDEPMIFGMKINTKPTKQNQ